MNRLHLDFNIDNINDRSAFLEHYINTIPFHLTDDECETCANYLLYGKNTDGRNSIQDKDILIETKYNTWTKSPTEESLDALLEDPMFSENAITPITNPPTLLRRTVFSRINALKNCPAHLISTYKNLFRSIDEIDLIINIYDLAHNRRTKPIRSSLLSQFTEQEFHTLEQRASNLSQKDYLALRHLIVELRSEQYTLKDTFTPQIQPLNQSFAHDPQTLTFDVSVPVYPFGLFDDSPISKLIYRHPIYPSLYAAKEIEQIIRFYWQKKDEKRPRFYIDFANPEHVYEIFGLFYELEGSDSSRPLLECSYSNSLLRTLEFYCGRANFSPIQQYILEQKKNKISNVEIATFINRTYGKNYSPNYISTIFCKKIIPLICAAALYHQKLIENLTFEENFKKCSACGEILLVSEDNFIRKARSKDGFASRCKRCDKLDRTKKKLLLSHNF